MSDSAHWSDLDILWSAAGLRLVRGQQQQHTGGGLAGGNTARNVRWEN